MTFDKALEELKNGNKVFCAGWTEDKGAVLVIKNNAVFLLKKGKYFMWVGSQHVLRTDWEVAVADKVDKLTTTVKSAIKDVTLDPIEEPTPKTRSRKTKTMVGDE